MRKIMQNVTTSKGNRYRTVTEQLKKTNFYLKGIEKICVERITSDIEKIYKMYTSPKLTSELLSTRQIKQEVEKLEFDLSQIEAEELGKIREQETPGFVLKMNGNLYYTEVPSEISFLGSNILGVHRCATQNKECKRLSALDDEEGGCAKVRNKSVRIEDYEWIKEGYETFNTLHDAFVVGNCLHNEMA